MSNKFEITVPLPPEMLIKRLEAARKEMAPNIGPCTATNDKSSFTGRVDYLTACAFLKATATEVSNETKVLVYINDLTIGHQPIAIVMAFAWLLFQLPLGALDYMGDHHKSLLLTAAWIIGPMVLLLLARPFSKHVLSRFVHDVLLEDTQT